MSEVSSATVACEKCNVTVESSSPDVWKRDAAIYAFKDDHRHETVAWVCYLHTKDGNPITVTAVFADELSALRHAVDQGGLKVAALESGPLTAPL